MGITSTSSGLHGSNTNRYNDLHGWADCVDRFIWVVKQTNQMLIVHGEAIVGLAYLVRQNVASGGIHCVWCVNHHIDLDTYWTEYYSE
jgi:hypothetical protein